MDCLCDAPETAGRHVSDEIEDAIRDAVNEPASASEDGHSATARSIDELIRADKYLAQKAVAAKRKTGIRFGRFVAGDSQ